MKPSLSKDERGAVYVEFLIAFMPLFVMFMSLAQLAYLEGANLVVKHSAVCAARAAMVVLPDNPATYDGQDVERAEGQRKTDVETAAKVPLLVLSDIPDVKVRYPSSAGGSDSRVAFSRDDIVRVQVEFNYPCRIPIGKTIVCGILANKKLMAEAAMPNQGADYEYPQ